MKTLILGIGNLLRSDDGVGLHVIEALRKEETGDNIDLMEALSGLDILDAIKDYDRIILVDAIKTGGEPGRFTSFPCGIFMINRRAILSQLI